MSDHGLPALVGRCTKRKREDLGRHQSSPLKLGWRSMHAREVIAVRSSNWRALVSSMRTRCGSAYCGKAGLVLALRYFSRRTPLNFFLLFFTSMNWPDFLLRFVQAVLPASLPLR